MWCDFLDSKRFQQVCILKFCLEHCRFAMELNTFAIHVNGRVRHPKWGQSWSLEGLGFGVRWSARIPDILLPSARHLEEGRGTTMFELPRLENRISRLCPRTLGSPPPPTPK